MLHNNAWWRAQGFILVRVVAGGAKQLVLKSPGFTCLLAGYLGVLVTICVDSAIFNATVQWFSYCLEEISQTAKIVAQDNLSGRWLHLAFKLQALIPVAVKACPLGNNRC